MNYLKFFVITSLSLISFGCVTASHYPQEWPVVPAENSVTECAPIIGPFEQQGVASVTKGAFWDRASAEVPALFSYEMGINASPPAAVSHLSVNFSAKDPGVTLWVNDELFLTHNFTPDELTCESGLWRLDLDWELMGSSGIFLDGGVSLTSLFVQQATDESVIIRSVDKHMGTVLLVLPFYIQEKEWRRFPLYTAEGKELEPNAPHGVLSDEKTFARLIPPPTQKSTKENWERQDQCLKLALDSFEQLGGALKSEEQTRIAGRSTQSFLVQWNKKSKAYPRTEYIDRTIGHTPTTHSAQLRKPHWLDPSVSDRYVLCLLEAGYVWEDVKKTE